MMLTDAAQAKGSHIVAVLLNRNYGQHSAIMAGFSHVTGDLIITLDADLQNPPEEIPRLVAKADEGYDVVGTVRQNRQDSLFRKLASRTINRLIQRTTGKAMGDYGCMLYDLITCLTTTPLRLLSVFGSIIALAGFALSVLLVVLRLVFGPQWAAEGVFMLFAVLFMFIGAQFVGMGLLGEYIGRIYNDVRARPRYFIQRVVRQEHKASQEEIHP